MNFKSTFLLVAFLLNYLALSVHAQCVCQEMEQSLPHLKVMFSDLPKDIFIYRTHGLLTRQHAPKQDAFEPLTQFSSQAAFTWAMEHYKKNDQNEREDVSQSKLCKKAQKEVQTFFELVDADKINPQVHTYLEEIASLPSDQQRETHLNELYTFVKGVPGALDQLVQLSSTITDPVEVSVRYAFFLTNGCHRPSISNEKATEPPKCVAKPSEPSKPTCDCDKVKTCRSKCVNVECTRYCQTIQVTVTQTQEGQEQAEETESKETKSEDTPILISEDKQGQTVEGEQQQANGQQANGQQANTQQANGQQANGEQASAQQGGS